MNDEGIQEDTNSQQKKVIRNQLLKENLSRTTKGIRFWIESNSTFLIITVCGLTPAYCSIINIISRKEVVPTTIILILAGIIDLVYGGVLLPITRGEAAERLKRAVWPKYYPKEVTKDSNNGLPISCFIVTIIVLALNLIPPLWVFIVNLLNQSGEYATPTPTVCVAITTPQFSDTLSLKPSENLTPIISSTSTTDPTLTSTATQTPLPDFVVSDKFLQSIPSEGKEISSVEFIINASWDWSQEEWVHESDNKKRKQVRLSRFVQ